MIKSYYVVVILIHNFVNPIDSFYRKSRPLENLSSVVTNMNNECLDFPGFRDADGDGCDWYYENSHVCIEWGDYLPATSHEYKNITSRAACCICDGGYAGVSVPSWSPTSIPSSSPSSVPSISILPTVSSAPSTNNNIKIDSTYPSILPSSKHSAQVSKKEDCVDFLGWTDTKGNKCTKYEFWGECSEKFIDFHPFSSESIGNQTTAFDACCFCGGGTLTSATSSSAPSSIPSLATFKSSVSPTFTISNNHSTSQQQGCKDIPNWHDSRGYTCLDYEIRDGFCEKFGNSEWMFGYTPYTSCCKCKNTTFTSGGGYYPSNTIFKAPEPKEKYYGNPLYEMRGYDRCIDFPGWTDKSGSYNCTYFNSFSSPLSDFYLGFSYPLDKCKSRGSFLSEKRVNASRACCGCGGGYDESLIGRPLRVGVPDDAEDGFTLFRNLTKSSGIDGSVYSLLELSAVATGFGMYQTPLSKESRSRFARDSYAACLNDLELGNIDLCLGSFWVTSSGAYVESEILSTDVFYLIVPTTSLTLAQRLFTTFSVFTLSAWFSILAAVFFMGVALSIIQKGGVNVPGYTWKTRFPSAFYHSFKTFATRRMSRPAPRPSVPEKFVTMALTIFSLVVLTAYTASLAASLSISFNKEKYASLQDVVMTDNINLCIQERVYETFLEKHPETEGLLIGKNMNETEILIAMDNKVSLDCFEAAVGPADRSLCYREMECEAAIVTGDIYYKVAEDKSFCKKKKILKNAPMLQVNKAIMMSSHFAKQKWGIDLRVFLAEVIEKGFYFDLHKEYKKRQSMDEFKCLEKPKEDMLKLDVQNLFGPLLLSMLLTIIGLWWFWKDHHYNLIRLPIKEKMSKMTHTLSGNKILSSKIHTQRDKDDMLHMHLQSLSPLDLINYLYDSGVDRSDLDAALNELPSKTKLVELAFIHQCSQYQNDFYTLNRLKVSELIRLAYRLNFREAKKNSGDDEEENVSDNSEYQPLFSISAVNDKMNPKKKLIEEILSVPEARAKALLAATLASNRSISEMLDEHEKPGYIED